MLPPTASDQTLDEAGTRFLLRIKAGLRFLRIRRLKCSAIIGDESLIILALTRDWLAEQLAEGLGMLHTDKADAKDQNEGEDGHYNAKGAHAEKEKADKDVDHVPASECEEESECRGVEFLHDTIRTLKAYEEHGKAHEGRVECNQTVHVRVWASRKDPACDDIGLFCARFSREWVKGMLVKEL